MPLDKRFRPSRSLSLLSRNRSGDTTLMRRDVDYPYGLRAKFLYPLPVYPMVIFLNFVLRMTWSVKLSSHLHSHVDGGQLVFGLEIAELVRRWLWVFVRVEWGLAKSNHGEEFEMRGKDSDETFEISPSGLSTHSENK